MKLPGLFQILVIALIILVLFGRGRISELLGDFGRGLKSFKRAVSDDEPAAAVTPSDGTASTPRAAADRAAG